MVVFLGITSLRAGSSESSLGRAPHSHGLPTVGIVTATEPSNHNYFSYRYSVNGTEYSDDDSSFVSAQTVDADQLHVGQQISVIYNSKDPQQPCSCDVNELASSAWVNELIPVLVLIPVILVMVIVLLMRHRRQRSQRADGAT